MVTRVILICKDANISSSIYLIMHKEMGKTIEDSATAMTSGVYIPWYGLSGISRTQK